MREPSFFTAHRRASPWLTRSAWPFSWVSGLDRAPCIGAYRLRFIAEQSERLRLIVTADERYRLYLDGILLRSGPEIGSRWRWQADAIDVEMPAGEHLFLAVVWSVGEMDGDYATDGIRHGFALGIDGPANSGLATGLASWEWHPLPGYTFKKSPLAHWTVPDLYRDATMTDWNAEAGAGSGWLPVQTVSPVHHVADVEIFPARLVELGTLPPSLYERWNQFSVRNAETLAPGAEPTLTPIGMHNSAFGDDISRLLLEETPLIVPPHSLLRAVIDFGTYVTAWPEFNASGEGAVVRIEWMEALSLDPVENPMMSKGNRDDIAGRYVRGLGDEVRCDANDHEWRSLYWRSGRYLIVTIRTGDVQGKISYLRLFEDRYPLEQEAHLEINDGRFNNVLPLCLRTLQVNAHDVFSDTPYYERMQYIGDCRIDSLITYILTRDDRLVVKALRMIDAQRLPDGLTVSRAPTRNVQVAPPFSLQYIGMIHDRVWWRGDLRLACELMPGVRGILDAFLRHLVEDGTLGHMEGWNFCDWSSPFPYGEPLGTDTGSGPVNLFLLMALRWAEDIETALNEPELAARWKRLRKGLAGAVSATFWDRKRGLWADDRGHTSFSQHAQALAALCPDLPMDQRQQGLSRLTTDQTLAPASQYFSHYLIEAWAVMSDSQSIVKAFGFWEGLPAQGFCAIPETPEPSRSDCHAFAAHPLFHTAATLAGIRPDAPGFKRVRIAPLLADIPSLKVKIPHPEGGWIAASLRQDHGRLQGSIHLPQGIGGTLEWGEIEIVLHSGQNNIG